MKTVHLAYMVAFLAGGCLLFLDLNTATDPTTPPTRTVSVGQAAKVINAYRQWKAGHNAERRGDVLHLSLSHWKGLSNEFARARGNLSLDLQHQTVAVEVNGLPATEDYDVWLVDSASGSSSYVDTDDSQLWLGRLRQRGMVKNLRRSLENIIPAGFEVDLAVVTRAGAKPEGGALLFGSPNLFQRLYYAERRGILSDISGTRAVSSSALLDAVVPQPAYAAAQGQTLEMLLTSLVADGEKLFFGLPPFEQAAQFDGNGRTCGTCHPAENNLTIEPAFIATLPADDPLFVAEFNPDLRELERPELLRNFGLILENVDGFEDPTNKFVMRSVPHLLALSTSITPPAGFSHANSTGWSGDGAPLDQNEQNQNGSLRAFAIGAVKQHFTRTLNRVEGIDFRSPTPMELDALEAFQLSLGRLDDPNLFSTFLKSEPLVQTGRLLFLQQGQCIFCHFNAGANDIIFRVNGNLDTDIEELADIPARLFDPMVPRDGGFGVAPDGLGGFGDGSFNPPSLIEAADTAPFFHNNARAGLEDAIRFYNSDTFNNSPGADTHGVSIELQDPQDVNAIGAFLRAMNALENIRNSLALDTQIKQAGLETASLEEGRRIMMISRADTVDALDVLAQGPHNLYADAQTHLKKSRKKLDQAIAAQTAEDRSFYLKKAIRQKKKARGLILVE